MRGRHGDSRLFPRLSRPQSAREAQAAPGEFCEFAALPAPLRRSGSLARPTTAPANPIPHHALSRALQLPTRNLIYSHPSPPKPLTPFGPSDMLELLGSHGSDGAHIYCSQNSARYLAKWPVPAKVAPSAPPVRELRETQYLVAPGLACNFYYNLVSWSGPKNSVAVAVAEAVYLWDGAGAIERVGTVASAVVCCVACSGENTAVASSDGVVAVLGRGRRVARKFGAAVQCVQWLPRENHFLAGTASGDVMCVCAGDALTVVAQMPGLTQQVCEIAVNADGSRAAIGGNENVALVWDISNPATPKLLQKLRHTSAVKGLSFCPWAPSLLASGAGSNDRHIRFWHATSGTMLAQVFTDSQISSIHWSWSRKELVVTYGFSSTPGRLIGVYSYPSMALVGEFVPSESLRALSSCIAPDETQIAVATSDGTVRVYDLWEQRRHSIVGGAGVLGSSIFETYEGVDVPVAPIR